MSGEIPRAFESPMRALLIFYPLPTVPFGHSGLQSNALRARDMYCLTSLTQVRIAGHRS